MDPQRTHWQFHPTERRRLQILSVRRKLFRAILFQGRLDGAIGAQYLAELRKLMENPSPMLF
jgi:hypothetical protein